MSKRNHIPESVKKQCVEMALEGMTYKEVYKTYYSKHYNTKFSGFRSCIKRWKKKYLEDKKYIEDTIGISNSMIKSVPNEENAVSIIFVDEDKITAYPIGTKEELGYYIDIPLNKEKHAEVQFEDYFICYVESENGIAKIMDLYEYLSKIY